MTADAASRVHSPVIVLAGMRSGSTLLQLLLDAHPALMCRAETDVMSLCEQIVGTGRHLADDADAQGADWGSDGREKSLAAAAAVAVDELFAEPLLTSGEGRWCDKTIDAAPSATAFARVFPNAQFVCLYRHCLDVVDSILEAFPWGLDDPRLAPFVRRAPGNSVAAAAAYWLRSTRAVYAFERLHPERCHRVYYEELVTSPDDTVAALFEALGERPAPGITTACFEPGPRTSGPGDHTILATSAIHSDSLGRGARVPIARIPPATRRAIRSLCRKLGYADIRAPFWPMQVSRPLTDTPATAAERALAEVDMTLESTVRTNLDLIGAAPSDWQQALGGRPIKLVVSSGEPDQSSYWLIGVDPPQVSRRPIEPEGAGAAWTITADAEALAAVMRGELNLARAMRARRIRVSGPSVDSADAGPGAGRSSGVQARLRLQIMARLLPAAGPRSDREDGSEGA